MNYVILAAGEGSRFLKEGVSTPKPMVTIINEPMIGRLIHLLMKCDAEKIVIVANSRMKVLVDYLEELKQKENLPLDIRPIISHSSYYSLLKATENLDGKFIAMTVDTIFPLSEFRMFEKQMGNIVSGEVLMGLTKYVVDESPLYAKIDDKGDVVDYKYGGEPFDGEIIVSAGIYGLTSEVMHLIGKRPVSPESLSDFQRILAAETDIRLKVFEFSKVIDVDRTQDQTLAEQLINEIQSNG